MVRLNSPLPKFPESRVVTAGDTFASDVSLDAHEMVTISSGAGAWGMSNDRVTGTSSSVTVKWMVCPMTVTDCGRDAAD